MATLKPKCPHCGSTEFRSADHVMATCDVTEFTIKDGTLTAEFCGESDVDWDSQGPANPAKPYQCSECCACFSEAEIIAAATGEEGGQAAPVDAPTFTPAQAVNAIRARIQGVWDDPDLERLGALLVDTEDDIARIVALTR